MVEIVSFSSMWRGPDNDGYRVMFRYECSCCGEVHDSDANKVWRTEDKETVRVYCPTKDEPVDVELVRPIEEPPHGQTTPEWLKLWGHKF